jgi:hypothetical protein
MMQTAQVQPMIVVTQPQPPKRQLEPGQETNEVAASCWQQCIKLGMAEQAFASPQHQVPGT